MQVTGDFESLIIFSHFVVQFHQILTKIILIYYYFLKYFLRQARRIYPSSRSLSDIEFKKPCSKIVTKFFFYCTKINKNRARFLTLNLVTI